MKGYIVDSTIASLFNKCYMDIMDLLYVATFILKDDPEISGKIPEEMKKDIDYICENYIPKFAVEMNDVSKRGNLSAAFLKVALDVAFRYGVTARVSEVYSALAEALKGEYGYSLDVELDKCRETGATSKCEVFASKCESISAIAREEETNTAGALHNTYLNWASEAIVGQLGAIYAHASEDNKELSSIVIGSVDKAATAEESEELLKKETEDMVLEEVRKVEERMAGVISDELVKDLADEIVTRAIINDESKKVIVLYGANSDINKMLVQKAMDKIKEQYTDFLFTGTLEVGGRGHTVCKNGDYHVRVVIYDTENENAINNFVRMQVSPEELTIVETAVSDIETDAFKGSGYRVRLTKEQQKRYFRNMSSIEYSGMPFIISEEAREVICDYIDSGASFRQAWVVHSMACANSICHENETEEVTAEDMTKACNKLRKTVADEVGLVRNLRENLGKGVIGQDEALDAITRAVKIARAGLNEEDKPIASFMFVGPTGTGKTETAKQLAKALDRDFVRIDMGDYKDQTAANKFSGASPGYVGYEDGSVIGKAMRGKEHCVLLFDEIEKAHPSVYDVMMHMLDNGEIKDNKGKSISFRDAIIIMTSNAGAREVEKRTAGFHSEEVVNTRNDRGLSDCVQSELELTFKPEFINRFDAIIQYNKLTLEVAKEITQKVIKELEERVGCSIKLTAQCIEELASKGTDIRFGAREIKRVVDRQIKAQLAEVIIDEGLSDSSVISIDYACDKYEVKIK